MTNQIPNENVAGILKHFLELPETPAKASLNDKETAVKLLESGVLPSTIESALLLATVRRLGRSPDLPPLSPIRSLAYFLPVIQELLNNPIPDDYVAYLRRKVRLLSRNNKTKPNCG
jgi:hypothetical protein